MSHLSRVFVFGALALSLVGCGVSPSHLSTRSTTRSVRALDDSDHAQMNAIVRSVLTSYGDFLAAADANKDGAIDKSELPGGDAEVAQLFFANFDGNKDGKVTGAEFKAALATDAPVEAYHHFTEERMSKAVQTYNYDQNFDFGDLRDYLTKELALTADWPLVGSLFNELDLNTDDKLLSGPGEGSAFMLKFARPTLQHALGMASSL